MDISTAIIAAVISAIVSIGIALYNSRRQKEAYRLSIRPYLSIKMILPPDDGIGGVPIKYIVHNLGNGVAFKPVVKEVFRTVDDEVQEGTSKIYSFDYDVILTGSEIEFTVDWHYRDTVQGNNESEIMEELIREYQSNPQKNVVDHIRVCYRDSVDNEYEQIATIEYRNPIKPTDIKVSTSMPSKVNE